MVQVLVFWLVLLVLLPVSVLGLIAYMLVIFANRPKGVSGTAYEPLMTRLMMHEAGTREDAAAERLAARLPASSPLIMLLLIGPARLAMRLSSHRPSLVQYPTRPPAGLTDMMTVRTEFFDQTLAQALSSVEQVVILGAGWDTRAYALPVGWQGRVFEVDTPATQAVKCRALAEAGISTDHVAFAATDFNEQSWLDAVKAHGFDPAKPAYLLWEGVTMYLDEAAVHDTLRSVAGLAAGSVIAFDYFAAELIRGERPYFFGNLIPLAMKLSYGEPFTFGISMRQPVREKLVACLEGCGLGLEQFESLGEVGSEKVGFYGVGLAGKLPARADRTEAGGSSQGSAV